MTKDEKSIIWSFFFFSHSLQLPFFLSFFFHWLKTYNNVCNKLYSYSSSHFFLFFFLPHNSRILLLLLFPSVMLLYIANSINHASLRFSSIFLTNIYNSTMSTCIHTKSPASLPFIFSWPLSFLTQQTKKKSLHHSLRRIYHLSHWYKYLSILNLCS